MLVIEGAQLRLGGLLGQHVGVDLQVDPADHGGADVRVGGGEIDLEPPLHQQLFGDHLIQHLVALGGRGLVEGGADLDLGLGAEVAPQDLPAVDQGDVLGREGLYGRALGGEQGEAGQAQAEDRSRGVEQQRTPRTDLQDAEPGAQPVVDGVVGGVSHDSGLPRAAAGGTGRSDRRPTHGSRPASGR